MPTDSVPLHPDARPAGLQDVGIIAALAARIGAAIDDEPVMSVEDVRAELSHPDLDLQQDTIVVVQDGRAVAFVIAYDEQPGRTELDPLIDPHLPPVEQDALLDAFLSWGIERADAFGRRRGLRETRLFTAAARDETAMFAAFARSGFGYARTFTRMRIDLGRTAPEASALAPPPAGVRLERVDPRDPHVLRRLHTVDDDGFADHWGFLPRTAAEFDRFILTMSGLDPAGTWIAVDVATGTDAGLLIGTDRAAEQGDGWVAELCIRPAFRGRGWAKALLSEAFAYYRDRGMAGVCLGVDAENPSGATALYRSVGMDVEQTWDVWELHLTLTD